MRRILGCVSIGVVTNVALAIVCGATAAPRAVVVGDDTVSVKIIKKEGEKFGGLPLGPIGTAQAVGFGFALTSLVLRARPGVTEANFSRIKVGMDVPAVEAIFGGPAEDLPQPALPFVMSAGGELSRATWIGNGGQATILFTEDSQVSEKTWLPAPRTLWQRLGDIFGID